jgi:putative membrane protein
MISYNPRSWFKFILTFHKEDTFRQLLPMLIAISAYSFVIACVEFFLWNFGDNTYIKNLSMLHNLLGFVLSLLLVFRTNSAYDRWWEGSIHWNSLISVSRNLAMKMNAILDIDDKNNRRFFLQSIPLFAFVLRDHLRISEDFTPMSYSDSHQEFEDVAQSIHKPNKVANLIYSRIYSLEKESKINEEQFLSVYPDVEKLNEICSACERIKNTPIPSSYGIFVKSSFTYTS